MPSCCGSYISKKKGYKNENRDEKFLLRLKKRKGRERERKH